MLRSEESVRVSGWADNADKIVSGEAWCVPVRWPQKARTMPETLCHDTERECGGSVRHRNHKREGVMQNRSIVML